MYYNKCNYNSNITLTIKLNNIQNQRLLYENDPMSDRGTFISLEPNLSSSTSFSSESIGPNLVSNITNLLYKVIWAFNQGYSSINIERIRKRVEEVLIASSLLDEN